VADPKEERWIWVGFAKESRLLLSIVVGPRMQESADELIKGIDSCLDKNNELPLFVSDGNNQYRVALFNLYNETVTPHKTGKRGRPKKPYKIPRTDLRYAQVINSLKYISRSYLGILKIYHHLISQLLTLSDKI